MTASICFKCGGAKSSPLSACKACSERPRHENALAISLVLSEHLSTMGQLAHFAHEIRNHLKLSVPSDRLAEAREALQDPQLMIMLGGFAQPERTASTSAPTLTHRGAMERLPSRTMRSSSLRSMQTSALHRNPFAILGVTNRDDRKKIVQQAEQKSLESDHDSCHKARSDLTNPRTRLSAEIAWLPGASPRKVSQLLEGLLREPMSIRAESGLPTLAHCNLMAAAFEAVNIEDEADDLADFILEMASRVDQLDVDEVMRDINEDRSVSGFPEIHALDQVESEISERKRYFKNSIKDALNRLPPASLLNAMALAVDRATGGGDEHAPELIDDLVDSYAIEVQSVLEKEAENVQKLIQAARDSVKSGESAVESLIGKIEKVARNWDKFARPIQLSAKARGIDHAPSTALAYSIRSLAIDLFNTHDMLESSQRLTNLGQELFGQLPEVSERVEQDAIALADIQTRRKQAESESKKREEEWAREITYSAEVGLVFKDFLSISPEGISWKENRYPLDSITAVRWGSVRHSVNGIPTGTDYTIAFATRSNSTVISLRRESTYSGAINALWRAVCIRLMIEMSEALKEGRSLNFGDMTIEDSGVTLTKRKFLGSNEKIRLPWSDVQVWNANGEFVIGSKADNKTYGSASFMDHWNTHLLDHLVRAGFKKGVSKLSDYFNE